MTESYWKNSQLSVVRHYGRCELNGHEYWIVNKEGKDLWQCSAEAEKKGNSMAIMPGEPADLVRKDFIRYYKKLHRERFLKVLRENPNASDVELKRIYQQLCKNTKTTSNGIPE